MKDCLVVKEQQIGQEQNNQQTHGECERRNNRIGDGEDAAGGYKIHLDR